VTEDRGNALRPEYVNAACDLWFLTHDRKYRDTAWSYFTAMRDHCRVANGYTVVKDVTTRPMTLGDYTPAYAFAENFKFTARCAIVGACNQPSPRSAHISCTTSVRKRPLLTV
jgi:hypothetical protein